MKKIRVEIPDNLSSDLKKLLAYEEADISGSLNTVVGNSELNTPSEIEKALSRSLDADSAETIMAFSIALSEIHRHPDLTAKEFEGVFRKGLEDKGWDLEEIERLEELYPLLIRLSEEKSVTKSSLLNSAKARLGNHLHSFSLETLIKPVFDGQNANIVAQVLYTQLRVIAASDTENEIEVTTVVNLRQLEKIMKDCKTAIDRIRIIENEEKLNKIAFDTLGSDEKVG